jgi:hypothetical protein
MQLDDRRISLLQAGQMDILASSSTFGQWLQDHPAFATISKAGLFDRLLRPIAHPGPARFPLP